jgi:hypothetical protein
MSVIALATPERVAIQRAWNALVRAALGLRCEIADEKREAIRRSSRLSMRRLRARRRAMRMQ